MPTVKVSAELWEIYGKRCSYCNGRVADPSDACVDHFIPGARYPDNGIENLVVADVACDGDKGSSLAGGEHVSRWAARHTAKAEPALQLTDLSAKTARDRHPERTISVARGIYLGLPLTARLWLRHRDLSPWTKMRCGGH